MVNVMRSIIRGPLAPYVAGFAAELLGQGYTRNSAEQHVCFVAHLDRWLLAEGLGVHELSESTIQRCLIRTSCQNLLRWVVEHVTGVCGAAQCRVNQGDGTVRAAQYVARY